MTERNRKIIKFYVYVMTIIYVMFFPVFCYMTFMTGRMFEDPTVPAALSAIGAMALIPVSMPISIYFMWVNFSRKKYRNTFLWGLLPFVAFGLMFFLVGNVFPRLF